MKTHTFMVTVEFADDIVSDDEVKEIAYKIADALKNGIAPDNSDTYTDRIEVTNEFVPKAHTVVVISIEGSTIKQE